MKKKIKLPLAQLLEYAKKNDPKKGKMWIGTMNDGGDVNKAVDSAKTLANGFGGQGSGYAALIGLIQQSVQGVQEAIKTGRSAAHMEENPMGMMKNDTNPFMAKGGWIQKATESIKRRGTEGVCTGEKFGSDSCPPGSKRYNLAKTFKKIAHNKKAFGGELTEFEGPSHENGGIPIDQNMNVNAASPDAEVEGGETGFDINNNQPFIFSDRLKDTDGILFSDKSKMIDKKYKFSDLNDIDKRSKNFEMEQLAKRNEAVKQIKNLGETLIHKYGGELLEYCSGGGMRKKSYAPGGYLGDPPGEDPILTGFKNLGLSDYPTKAPSELKPIDNSYIPPVSGPKLYDDSTSQQQPTTTGTWNGSFDPFGGNGQGITVPDALQVKPRVAATPNDYATDDTKLTTDNVFTGTPTESTTGGKSDFDLNKVAIGLKGSALVQSFLDSVKPAEREKLQQNMNIPEVEQIMESLGVNYTSALNEARGYTNAAIENARNNAGSFTTSQVLASKAIGELGRTASDIKMKEQEANNALRSAEANVKFQTGESDKVAKLEQQTRQSMNDARQRLFVRDFYSNLSQIGSEFNKKQYVKDMIENNQELAKMTIAEGLAILGSKYENFGLTKELIDRLKSGSTDVNDYIKFYNAVGQAKESTT